VTDQSRIDAKKDAIRRFHADIAEFRSELDHYESGWRIGEHRGDGDSIDTTEKHVEFLTRSIAEYERMITILERQVREA
jgi:hypothetical protein